MGLYRLIKGAFGRVEDGRRVSYHAGRTGRDVLELNDEDAKAMSARIVPYIAPPVVSVDEEDGTGAEVSEAERDAEVHNTPAADAIKRIHDIDNVDDLKLVEGRENRNPNGPRKTVLNAIAHRIAHLTK